MDKKTLKQIQDALERAVLAYEKLKQAIDANDQRKIGAALFELRQALKDATTHKEQQP